MRRDHTLYLVVRTTTPRGPHRHATQYYTDIAEYQAPTEGVRVKFALHEPHRSLILLLYRFSDAMYFESAQSHIRYRLLVDDTHMVTQRASAKRNAP